MKRLISDERLETLIKQARRKEGGYWTSVIQFLRSIQSKKEITRPEHNWLAEIRQELTNPWE